ncbi:unnamed protein product [Arctia plantaginis]|uniref:Uncharacterized protein n=1 Tax=Arctia plantaginis TaxID=874455 RepID=A0A8S1BLF9_ARCPL|nr:unnamed protein product [Arctia plantaginis]
MAVLSQLYCGILILQIYVNAAPSDVGKLEEIATVAVAGEKLDPIKEVGDNASSIENVREKRYYNPYGFPPINPLVYPGFTKRDDYGNVGNYGIEDPLEQIHRHVQEIANFVRQPQPPRIPHVPIFYPVLFVPPFDCNCNPNNYQPIDQPTDQFTDGPIDRPTEPSTDTPGGQTNYPVTPNEESPEKTNLTNRFSEMDDERRNWGFFINRTGEKRTPNQEFSRPISFDPIRLNQPTLRPSPPVEHGTLQSDVTGNQETSSPQNDRSSPPPNLPPSTTRSPPPSTFRPTFGQFNPTRPPPSRPQNAAPTACDAAIIACCHRPLVAYDCFAIQGCPNITSYGNPCDTNSILRIIERLQRFYASRSG